LTQDRVSKDDFNTREWIGQPGNIRHHPVPGGDEAVLERGLGKRKAFTATCTTEEAPKLSRIILGRNHRRIVIEHCPSARTNVRNAVQVIAPADLPLNAVVRIERQASASDSGRKWRAGGKVYTDEANAAGQIGRERLVAKVAAREVDVDSLGCRHL